MFKILAISLVNIIFFVLAIKWLRLNINLNLVSYEMSRLNFWSIAISGSIGILLYLFYGIRMALLLDINVLPSSQIVVLGFGFNAILPFRFGELLKFIFAKQFFKINFTKIAFASVVEKLFDIMILASLGAIFLSHRSSHFFLLGFVLLLLIIFFCLKPFVIKFTVVSRLFSDELAKSFSKIITINKLPELFLTTVIIWLFTCSIFFIFFNMNLEFKSFVWVDAINLLLLTTLSLAIPSLPASVGLFESGIVYYLTTKFHINPNEAVAYSVVYHLIMVLPQIILSLGILLVNFRRIQKVGVTQV